MAAGVLLVAAGSLVVAAYLVASRGGDPDGTTEVSAIVVLGAGVLAGSGPWFWPGGGAAVALVSLEKPCFVFSPSYPAISVAAFAMLAAVVLPFCLSP